mmetsp:Transcript_22233/g.34841  ORF Transcript_22233/g.34841 Transcript_22233/m.34841 type:complete len:116 (-) Transcript_22233:175-522(-)|eukprot:CAMPEP_0184325024 /NCGR_PEP_ID=MMETSP1049-20130417/138153_1 /TAXON_ID=77928 /ORGANISM="Proteomonas sulcata, Strain CCMP704" /LENGTH=115 /DNA_ID=CAMNT_0026646955 /DNA_START=65 /DNA_END=412 /DNA_ORIENTATION=-
MANNLMFDELKAAINNVKPGQLNAHSTLKAMEHLLACLKRDGVSTAGHGGSSVSSGNSGPGLHYGMNYVDGGKSPNYATGYAPTGHTQQQQINMPREMKRSTEGIMPGSSWSTSY